MSTLQIADQLRMLADLLCKPLQLTEQSDDHSAPLYLYELTKIIRLYAPMLYYCDKKLISGTSTAHIMRIHVSRNNELFVTDFKNIYRMNQINNPKTSKKKKKKKTTAAHTDIYKSKISKTESKKLLHRTISKKKRSPFFKCSVVVPTKIDENFEIDPDGNIFYVLGVGFFKEAIFVLRRKQNNDDKKESEYSKPRRVHTFGSGEGNRIISVNGNIFHKEKKNKYVILHCRALDKVFRMKYCVKTHDLKVEQWRISPTFLRIQWLISYPFNDKLCFGLVVDWDMNMVILYGILLRKDNALCVPFEIFRFKLRELDKKSKSRAHHCYCMCYLRKLNKLCIVIEGECFLVYAHESMDVDDINDCKNNWNKYNVGMLFQKDVVDGTKYFYPKSITQFKDTSFVIGVDGGDTASMFQIL